MILPHVFNASVVSLSGIGEPQSHCSGTSRLASFNSFIFMNLYRGIAGSAIQIATGISGVLGGLKEPHPIAAYETFAQGVSRSEPGGISRPLRTG
jgi:hypothetical protein